MQSSDPHPSGAGPLDDAVEMVRLIAPAPQALMVLALWAQQSVPGVAHASFTLIQDGVASTPGASGGLAANLDRAQYLHDTGPCLDAARTGQQMSMTDARTEARWPDFARAALFHGVLASLSLPIPATAGAPLTAPTAMNLYATSAGAFDAASVRTAEALAVVAGTRLAEPALLDAVAEDLAAASADGDTISRACRSLAERDACAPNEAFAKLVDTAHSTGMPLVAVARELLGSTGD